MKNLSPKDYSFVGIQLILFIGYTLPISIYSFEVFDSLKIILLGLSVFGIIILIMAILKLNKNLTAFPTPKTDGQLISDGLYRYIRHPIYTGIILFVFSYAIYRESFWKILIATCLLILFYFKTEFEEKQLKNKFEDYESYQKKTGRFFPKIF